MWKHSGVVLTPRAPLRDVVCVSCPPMREAASSNALIPFSPRVMTTAEQPKCANSAVPACSTDSSSVSARVTKKPASLALHTMRSEEHTSELQSRLHLVCRLLLEKKKKKQRERHTSHVH